MTEVIDLDDDEISLIVPKPSKKFKCLNPECKSKSDLIKASHQVKRFFGVMSYPKKTRICFECCATANVHSDNIAKSIRERHLIFTNPLAGKKNTLILSDSESDPSNDENNGETSEYEIDGSEFDLKNSDGSSSSVMDIISHISKDLGLHLQIKAGINNIKERLNESERQFSELNSNFASLETDLDGIRNDFYESFKEPCYMQPEVNFGSNQDQTGTNDVTEIATDQRSKKLLPPKGSLIRPKLNVNDVVYAVHNHLTYRWIPAIVLSTSVTDLKFSTYKIKYKSPSTSDRVANMYGSQLAYSVANETLIPVGTRIVAKYVEPPRTHGSTYSSFYVGIIAESPSTANKDRYLIFFDDGYAQYVEHSDVRVVVESSTNIWEDVASESREFIKDYIQMYPERPMVRLQKFNYIKTEYNGRWWKAQVIELDASLVKMWFPTEGRTEWIYRGSTRLSPLFEKKVSMQVKTEQSNKVVRRRTIPYRVGPVVEYVNDDPFKESRTNATGGERRAVARKSTTGRAGTPPLEVQQKIIQEGKGFMNKLSFSENMKTFEPHQCSAACVKEEESRSAPKCAPLTKPFYYNWRRQLSKQRKKTVTRNVIAYTAPCGRRLRSIEEIVRFLRLTNSFLEIDFFSFEIGVDPTVEWSPDKKKLFIDDISNGVEDMPISCINSLAFDQPNHLAYCSVRQPIANVDINTDPEFLVCCSCEDDCQDKSRCECWLLTFENMTVLGQQSNDVGYSHRRLHDQVATGIYECNSKCRCNKTCLNRVVQHPIRQKLQLFKTAKRGWGVRTLHDIPRGSFLSVYVGKVLSENVANEEGKMTAGGDDYYAELDFIEVAEAIKEGYESDVDMDPEISDRNENPISVSTTPNDSELSDAEEPTISGTTHKYDIDHEFNLTSAGIRAPEKRKPSERIKARGARTDSDEISKSSEMSNDVSASDSDENRRPSQKFEPLNVESIKQPNTKKNLRSLFGDDESVYIMDAKVSGNIGRYFNHSCQPNIFVQNVFVDTHDIRFPWVAFFSAMNIRAGTELTWDYNYEVGSVPGKIKYCYCMSKKCRGRLL